MQQIVVQRCNRLYICNVVGVLLWCPVIADVLVACIAFQVEHILSLFFFYFTILCHVGFTILQVI